MFEDIDLKVTCNQFNLTNDDGGCYAIEQGATFNWLVILHPDDLTGWTPRGQIRKNYADLDTVVLINFAFEAITYGPETIDGVTSSYSKIIPTLTATQTSSLPVPKARTGDYKPGANCWVYQIEAESPSGVVIRLKEGFVDVSPEVTR